jgi:hypothetical protein
MRWNGGFYPLFISVRRQNHDFARHIVQNGGQEKLIKEKVKKSTINEQGQRKEEPRRRRVNATVNKMALSGDGGEREIKVFLFMVYLTTISITEAI